MKRRSTQSRKTIRRASVPAGSALCHEALENRKLLAAAILYDAAADIVNIHGTSTDDNVQITWLAGNRLNVVAWDSSSSSDKTFTGPVTEIRFKGGEGNDWIRNDSPKRLYGQGMGGHDQLIGGSANDMLDGGSGDDQIWGYGGHDTLYGGTGNDQLVSGDGQDWTDGGPGNDLLWGEGGDDILLGGTGNDRLMGEAGADKLLGGTGNDDLIGSSGNDLLLGETGDDKLYGQAGNDQLNGGPDRDWLFGNEGDDTLVAIDSVFNDYLDSGSGSDTAWVNRSGTSLDTVIGASTTDKTHLVTSFANGADLTLNGDRIADPAVGIGHSYQTFNGLKLFSSAGPRATDVRQGKTNDCYFLSGLGSVALQQPQIIRQNIVDLNDGTFGVKLGTKFYRVDNDLPVYVGGYLVNARLGAQNSGWVAIYEKAFAHHRTGQNSYNGLDWGWSTEAFTALGMTNARQARSTFSTAASYAMRLDVLQSVGRAVTVTSLQTMGSGTPLVSNHAYMVTSCVKNAAGTITHVVLRNPWGTDGGTMSDGVNDGAVSLSVAQLFAMTRMLEWGRP